MTQRDIGPVWIVQHSNPNRVSRRCASKERRRKLTAYNNEITAVRALHTAREIRRGKTDTDAQEALRDAAARAVAAQVREQAAQAA